MAVLACNLPSKSVTVRADRDMREDVVWIDRGRAPLPEGVLECIAQASLSTSYYVYFKDEATQTLYNSIYWRLSKVANIAQATEWLRARNLLATVPLPQKGIPLATYTRAVEAFCGIKEGSRHYQKAGHGAGFREGPQQESAGQPEDRSSGYLDGVGQSEVEARVRRPLGGKSRCFQASLRARFGTGFGQMFQGFYAPL